MILLHKKFFIVEKVLQIIKILTLRKKTLKVYLENPKWFFWHCFETPFWNLYLSVYEILLKCF